MKKINLYNTKRRKGATKYWDFDEKIDSDTMPPIADTLSQFERSRKELGPDWYYYDKGDISYVYNKQGFRTVEFDNLDWNNSILLCGCSIVEGIGNPIENTIGYYLEELLDIPVINLGVSGSAVDFSVTNSLLLYEYGIRPKAMVNLWTSLDRYTNFNKLYYVDQVQVRNHEYYFNHNWDIRSKNYIIADRVLWKPLTLYYEASFFKYTSETMNIDFMPYKDVARDLAHPGYKSNKKAAELIAKNLILQGIE